MTTFRNLTAACSAARPARSSVTLPAVWRTAPRCAAPGKELEERLPDNTNSSQALTHICEGLVLSMRRGGKAGRTRTCRGTVLPLIDCAAIYLEVAVGAAEQCMESACVRAARAGRVTPQTDSSACLRKLVDPMLTEVQVDPRSTPG